MSPVTQKPKIISQQKTPVTNTGTQEGTRKLNPQKRRGNVKKSFTR